MFSKLFRYNQTKFRSTKLGNNQNIVLELLPLLQYKIFLYDQQRSFFPKAPVKYKNVKIYMSSKML